MFPGQLTVGTCVSLTVTVKLHATEFSPPASADVHVTVLTPLLNVLPEVLTEPVVAPVEVHVTVAVPQLSAPVTE